jgi:hypothetical protein
LPDPYCIIVPGILKKPGFGIDPLAEIGIFFRDYPGIWIIPRDSTNRDFGTVIPDLLNLDDII